VQLAPREAGDEAYIMEEVQCARARG
jgi:hypothetical protein